MGYGDLSGLPIQSQVASEKKLAIPCIRREVYNNSSSQNLYLPNSRMKIPVETGTPGQFIDPSMSYLCFDVNVINQNPCIDFIDLPRIGWACLIRELTIEANGMPSEQYRWYNDTCACRAIVEGSFHEKWDYYVENDWRPMKGMAGPFHVNFIKPCMISRSGFSQYVTQRELSGALNLCSHSSHSNSQTGMRAFPDDGQVEYDILATTNQKTNEIPIPFTYAAGPEYLTGIRLFFPEVLIDRAERHVINRIEVSSEITRTGVLDQRTLGLANTVYTSSAQKDTGDDENVDQATLYIPNYADEIVTLNRMAITNNAAVASISQCTQNSLTTAGDVSASGLHPNDSYFMTAVNPVLLDMRSTGARSRMPLWTIDQSTKFSDLACDKSDSRHETARPRQNHNIDVGDLNWYLQPCPARWPIHFNPYDYEKLKIRNHQDKCRVTEEFERITGGNNVKNIPIGFREYHPNNLPIVETRFHVQIPLESVLIGNRAQSWFPATLIPQGKFSINIVWEEPRKAFQISMDPCRLLDNTLRIRAENMGFIRSERAARSSQYLNANGNVEPGAVKFSAIHSSMLIIPDNDPYIYFNYNSACAMGTFAIPSLLLAEAVTGEFFTPRRLIGVSMGDMSNQGQVRELEDAAVRQIYTENYTTSEWSKLFSELPETVVNNRPTDYHFAGLRQCWSNTCHPVPQSLPYNAGTAYAPVLFDQNSHDIELEKFCCETQLIYGTYLEASVPQTRRCMSSLEPIVNPPPNHMSKELIYEISNVSFNTVEYLLPESATASITILALETGLTQEIDTVKLQTQFLPKAVVQKPLINGSASYVNAMSCFFRRTEQTQVVQAFGYNSFSFLNPFVNVTCTDNEYVDVGGNFRLETSLDMSRHTGIRVQLQIGGEYIPRNAIDDVFTLLRKTMEGDSEFVGMTHHKHFAPFSIAGDRTKDSYHSLQFLQDGFWAPFIPIKALDDQTCTANPYWIPYEMDLVAARSDTLVNMAVSLGRTDQGRLRARRPPCLTNYTPNQDSIVGVLPFFKPLDGTFHLSFNLRTFVTANHLNSGVAIVNNNVFLLLNNAFACQNETIEMLTLYHCEGKVIYERGGNIMIWS